MYYIYMQQTDNWYRGLMALHAQPQQLYIYIYIMRAARSSEQSDEFVWRHLRYYTYYKFLAALKFAPSYSEQTTVFDADDDADDADVSRDDDIAVVHIRQYRPGCARHSATRESGSPTGTALLRPEYDH